MSKPLKEDYIIRIKSRIEQRLDEPAAEEEKEEFVELMTRGSFVLKGGSYYVTYRETETTGYEGCTTTLKIAADGSRVAMLRFGKGGGAGTQLLIEKGRRNLCHYAAELLIESGQPGIIFLRFLINPHYLELSAEDAGKDKFGLVLHAGLFKHREKLLVLTVIETEIIAVRTRVRQHLAPCGATDSCFIFHNMNNLGSSTWEN